MSEEKNDTGTNNSISPNDLFNNPDNNQPVTESTAEVQEEPVTLTPEPAEIEAEPVVASATNEISGEVNPIQTDLNQVPPTPQVDTSNQTNGVTQTVTQTVNPTETSPFPNQDMTNTGFTEKLDKKKGIKKPLIIVGCIVVLAILGYFVIYPIIAEKFMASPKNVFEATINKLSTNVNNTLDQVNIGSSLYEIEAKFDTNIEDLKPFANYNYKFKGGMDSKNKLIEGSASMTGTDNKEIGAQIYVKNDYLFYKLSNDERIVKSMNLAENEDYKMLFSDKETINSEDLKYLIDKSKELLFKELKDDDFTKENNYKLTVNGSEITVTKNALEINKDKYITLYKALMNGLYEDSKAMDILNKMGISKEDYKEEFIDIDLSKLDDNYKTTINVYSVKADVIGFDIYSQEDKEVYFYSNDGNFESAMLPGDEKNEISFVGIKDGDATNATLKVAKEEVARFKIYNNSEKEIKFDYTINSDDDYKITGTVDIKNNDNVTSLDLSAKAGDEYININGKIKIDNNVKIADFDDSKAVSLSEEEQDKLLNDFLEKAKGSPLDFLTGNLGGVDYNNYEYYDDYNSITPSEVQPSNSF